jgi:hypothetical protein
MDSGGLDRYSQEEDEKRKKEGSHSCVFLGSGRAGKLYSFSHLMVCKSEGFKLCCVPSQDLREQMDGDGTDGTEHRALRIPLPLTCSSRVGTK